MDFKPGPPLKESVDLCVRNVKENISIDVLEDVFLQFGSVVYIRPIQMDRTIVFVRYQHVNEAKLAIERLKNNDLGIIVDFAWQKKNRSNFNGNIQPQANATKQTSLNDSNHRHGVELVRRCVVCEEIGHLRCSRCGDCYCSSRCQKFDWEQRRHRLNCFEMPPLIAIDQVNHSRHSKTPLNQSNRRASSSPSNSLNGNTPPRKVTIQSPSKISDRSPTPRNNAKYNQCPESVQLVNDSLVALTYVTFNDGKWMTFVRPLDEDAKYLEIVRAVNDEGKIARPLKKSPECRDIVIAPYESAFYRALIFSADPINKQCRVGYLEFGNISLVPTKDLREISDESMQATRYVVRVHLKGLPKVCNDEAMNYGELLVDEVVPLTLKFDGDFDPNETEIELFDGEINVNEKLRNILKNRANGMEINKRILVDSHIFVLNNSTLGKGYVTCVSVANLVKYQMINEKLKKYCDRIDAMVPYRPKMKEICLVKLANRTWKRAQHINTNVHTKKLRMMLIDEGGEYFLDEARIRPLPAEQNYPVLSAKCFIGGLDVHLDNLSVVAGVYDILIASEEYKFDRVEMVGDLWYGYSRQIERYLNAKLTSSLKTFNVEDTH